MDAYLRYAEHTPFHDPSPLVAIMAAVTRRIGLAAHAVDDLLSAVPAGAPADHPRSPEPRAHRLECRDVLQAVEEALNFGYQELLDHDQRYDRADEYMELCAQLWSSWAPGRGGHGPDDQHLRRRGQGARDRLRGHLLSLARAAQRHAVAAGAPGHHPGRRVGPRAGLRRPPRRGRHRRPGDGGRDEAVLRRVQGPGDAARARSGRLQGLLPRPSPSSATPTRRRSSGRTSCTRMRRSRPDWPHSRRCCRLDLSTFDLDQPLPGAIQTRATQGIRSQLDGSTVRADPDPAGHRDPQGQHRLEAVHRDAGARRRRAGATPSTRSAATASPSGRASGRATSARSWSRSSRCSSSAEPCAPNTRGRR